MTDLLSIFRVPPLMLGNSPSPRSARERAQHRLIHYDALGIDPPWSDEAAWQARLENIRMMCGL